MTEHELTGPEHGARLLVRLRADAATAATDVGVAYTVVLATLSSNWEATATVRESDGRVEVGAWSEGEPPGWLVQAAHALLRAAWQRKRAGHAWPRRLARWRPGPETGEP